MGMMLIENWGEPHGFRVESIMNSRQAKKTSCRRREVFAGWCV